MEAKLQVDQATTLQNEEEAKEIKGDATETITSKLKEYILEEMTDPADKVEIYNILPCPMGNIQGDEDEITTSLERTYTESMSKLTIDQMMWREPDFQSQLDKVI